MKKLATLSFAILTLSLNAQYYTGPEGTGNPGNKNPEDLEYPVGGGLPSGWTTIHNGSQINAAWSPTQTLPFGFQFNGSAVSQYKVSTSGVLTFTTTAGSAPSSINYALPNSAIPNKSICVWGISGKGSNDKIITKTFGTAPNRQHWVMFNDYSIQTEFNSHYTYWSIVLEENTNRIYIVDQRTSANLNMALTLGIQVNNTTAYSAANSPQVTSLGNGNANRSDNVFYAFYPGVQPNLDLSGDAVLFEDVVSAQNGPYPMKYVVQNLGKDTIHSLDINFSNSGSLKTLGTLTGLNILPWQIDTLEHPNTWNPQPGVTTIKVWGSNINGAADENTNNDTAFKPVTILSQTILRTPLIESFTSSTSPQSKSANEQIQNTLNAQSQPVTHIKYPMSWPGSGDPYFTNEGGSRRLFYSVSTVPNVQIDGKDWTTFNSTINPSLVSSARSKIALINLTAEYYVSGKEVCADVNITSMLDINNPDLKLYVAVYEKETTGNIKNSGESKFYNVMKKMLPDANGVAVGNLATGVEQNQQLCFTFKGNYTLPANANNPVNLNSKHTVEQFSNLGVVAWLQDENTKVVFQSAEAHSTISINEFNEAQNIAIYPNPAQEYIYVTLDAERANQPIEIALINISGQKVYAALQKSNSGETKLEIPVDYLANGIYILHVKMGNASYQEKVIKE